MSEDAFEYVWRIIKADDDEMMRRLEEGMLSDQTHPNECEECGQPGGLSNYPDDSICDDCMSAHADAVDPLPPDQRLIDMANAAHSWGQPLAYEDYHDSVFEEHTMDLDTESYWEAIHAAQSLQEDIWSAGMAALGLETTEDMECDFRE